MNVPIKQLQFLGLHLDILEDDGGLKKYGEVKISFSTIKEKVTDVHFLETCTKNEEEVIKELFSKDLSDELSLRLIRDILKHKEWDDVTLVNGLDNISYEVNFDVEIKERKLIIKYSEK